MKIEHRYFVLTQHCEKNNLPHLHKLLEEGWLPSRETQMPHSSDMSDRGTRRDFSHCLIFLYRESKNG